MSVRIALARSVLLRHVGAGKQALRAADRAKVIEESAVRVVDSIDFDSATQEADPSGHRWDYLIGTKAGSTAQVVGIEVHPATTGQVKVVIAKKRAALTVTAREFSPGHRVNAWVWVASGTTAIPATSREARQLAAEGIRLSGGVLNLRP